MSKGRVGLGIALVAGVVGLVGYTVNRSRLTPTVTRHNDSPAPAASSPLTCQSNRLLRLPSDSPARLSCEQAKRVVKQARDSLAEASSTVDVTTFGHATGDWLDPHGLWSAAPDAPIASLLAEAAPDILNSLERDSETTGCRTAREVGARIAAWVNRVRAEFDASMKRTQHDDPGQPQGWAAAQETLFEDGPVARPAMDLSSEIGRRVGQVLAHHGPETEPFAQSARSRFFPSLDATQWGEAILAAAVRAYILQIDPHGAWAPLDEETSLYEVELEASGRSRLWFKMSRTSIGLRVDEGPMTPLVPGDVVLAIGGVPTAGLSVEQAEQHGLLDPEDPVPERNVTILRQGVPHPFGVIVVPTTQELTERTATSIASERIRYGKSEVLSLSVADVPDDLGEEIASVLAEERAKASFSGLLLDLRGNGGGSTDGARATIGLFLPDAPLFPMRRRDGTIEVERAARPPRNNMYSGPLAVLVDSGTASAAEMIAGALASYRRANLAGSKTYGKGCAQEYMDDEVGVGVLRLTTLMYSLPDGSPVQRVGLTPDLMLGPQESVERESSLSHAFAAWSGPDVRRRSLIGEVPWPSHSGRVGPCDDDAVCRALRLLGAPRTPTARGRRP